MESIDILKKELQDVLQNNILAFWLKTVDEQNGGFYGTVTGNDEIVANADKGAVLNTRILWTFSAAYRVLGKPEYLEKATRAKKYLIDHFYDKEFGGIYWSLDYKGEPIDTKKQIYALGFAIYGLSEYHRATNDQEALDYAIELFHTVEKYSFDKEKNGYCEALTREWGEIADMRLSEKDENERKTMNTHLHIIEPYTNLYRVWKSDLLRDRLTNLLEVFLTKILDTKTGHLKLFFDDDWTSKVNITSYGHDIEASWLLHETALELGNRDLLARVEAVVPLIAKAASEGILPDGSMFYERNEDTGHEDKDRHWWVQAEAIIGYMNLYQHFGDKTALAKALATWEYTKKHFIDFKNGEWYWSINADGSTNFAGDKAGFWKCPYHNSRMCMELIERKFE